MNIDTDNPTLASSWVNKAMGELSTAIDVNEEGGFYSAQSWELIMDAWKTLEGIKEQLQDEESGELPRSRSVDLY